MRSLYVALAFVAATGCQSARPDPVKMADAIRFGVEACERHYLDGVPMADALAASAQGRSFEPVERKFEDWTNDSKPWRLSGLDVWVGLATDKPDEEWCGVLAVNGGSMALRDELVREHVARTDRTWTAWSTGGGGRRAACTTDRVPGGKSLLVVAHYNSSPSIQSADIVSPSADEPPEFGVTVVNEAVCDRNS